ncbi:M1 family aminopeptidase [Kribbella sp. NBC_01245]|uniref:M1 family aminopeptidase n=1 Tax=Kribbella sp. NBC_01245 TaxID=2903578 RepID=UPI002E2D879C|nr:M1 family aminopeptidase [Kribbella sp. NBC_01245]
MTKEGFEANGTDGVVLHELAHEWFGNSVSPERWADLWLYEGHAVYYQIEWSQRRGTTMAESMRQSYTEVGNKLLDHGPIAQPNPAKWTGMTHR